MPTIVKIDRENQIVIPKSVGSKLRFKGGEELFPLQLLENL